MTDKPRGLAPASTVPTVPQLRLQDLLDHTTLGLSAVVAADPLRRVRGAHSIEIDGAGRWLPPGFVMLTTGLRFASTGCTPHEARAVVDDLVAARAAALLFGVGLTFQEVPVPLVQACAAAGLPLLLVPARVPFWQVEDFVQQSLRSVDAYRVQRTLWLQSDLLHALAQDRPVATIIARLGSLVSGSAALYEDSGRVVASTGGGPMRLIWSQLRTRGVGRHRFSVGRWRVVSSSAAVRGVTYTIALASQREALLDDLGEILLDTAARLLAAIGGAKALGTTQARADAALLLATLQAGVTPEEATRLWERLRGYRFVVDATMRCFAAVPIAAASLGTSATGAATTSAAATGATALGTATTSTTGLGAAATGVPGVAGARAATGLRGGIGGAPTASTRRPPPAEDLWLELHEEATATALPVLMREESEGSVELPEGALWGIVGDQPALAEWVEHLRQTHHVGLSAPYTALMDTRTRFREATRAVTVAIRRAQGRAARAWRDDVQSLPSGTGGPASGDLPAGLASAAGGEVVDFADLDLATWLLSGQDREPLEAKAGEQLARLHAHPPLVATVIAYLGNHLDVQATAAALYLHPNSVRYRLQRAEEMLGAPLHSPAVIANLYLAFHDELASWGEVQESATVDGLHHP